MRNSVTIRNITIGDGVPKICVSLVGGTPEGIREELGEFSPGSFSFQSAASMQDVELVEFRADHFTALESFEALDAMLREVRQAIGQRVLIFTIRSAREGGNALGFSKPDYYEINRHVIENGLADLVDLELFSENREEICALIGLAHEKDVRVIMSSHDFDKTPENEEMMRRLLEMEKLGADIAKLAVMPQTKEDVERLMLITKQVDTKIPVVTMSMGELGMVSRISGRETGSAFTFAALKKSSAPGQLPVAELVKAIRGRG